jgi:sigma-B regulation protein RsbU (phosphoserine phosphatase)
MPPVKLGAIIFFSFLPPLVARPFLNKRYIIAALQMVQPQRAFLLDFSICIFAGILMNGHNYLRYDIPFGFVLSPMIGCLIAGLFIGLDSALAQERHIIVQAIQGQTSDSIPNKLYPVTQKFTLVAVTASALVAIVIILIFARDIQWLADNIQNANAIHDVTMTVIIEVFFIVSVLIILIVNLILSYSKNLQLLFKNETEILVKVSNGDLSGKVPVVTQDEFGFIAGHTNQMIDGLRHRFKLINSLKLAEEVQQNLLPQSSPFLKGFDISGSSIYCDQTGGDYYDYFLLPNQSLGVVVADAVGHGIGAAMLMTSVRAFLTSAIQRYQNPAGLIREVNQYISNDCEKSGRFTSMFFVEINPQTKKLTWIRAGHEPPLLYHVETDSFSQLEGAGLVLGIDSRYDYEENITQSLTPGDIILIGTDGISEATNQEGLLFGRERIKQIIRQYAHKTAREIQERLFFEVQNFYGNVHQQDDITLVLIKVREDSK